MEVFAVFLRVLKAILHGAGAGCYYHMGVVHPATPHDPPRVTPAPPKPALLRRFLFPALFGLVPRSDPGAGSSAPGRPKYKTPLDQYGGC
jgi:hypothetical protein